MTLQRNKPRHIENYGLRKLQTELNDIQNTPVDNQTAAIKQIKTKLDSDGVPCK